MNFGGVRENLENTEANKKREETDLQSKVKTLLGINISKFKAINCMHLMAMYIYVVLNFGQVRVCEHHRFVICNLDILHSYSP